MGRHPDLTGCLDVSDTESELEQRHDEWRACMDAARAALSAPLAGLTPDPTERLRITEHLRIWRWPSFAPSDTWVFLTSHSGRSGLERHFVRRLRWCSDVDSERLHSPLAGLAAGFHSSPTLEAAERDVGPAEITDAIHRLEGIGLGSLAPKTHVLLDGVRCGLSIPDHLTVEWNAVPTGWEQLAAWVDEKQAWLDALFAGSEHR